MRRADLLALRTRLLLQLLSLSRNAVSFAASWVESVLAGRLRAAFPPLLVFCDVSTAERGLSCHPHRLFCAWSSAMLGF